MTRRSHLNRPFDRLPIKKRACFILHIAGYSERDICNILGAGKGSVNRYISMGYDEYGEDIGAKYTIVRENKISPPRTYQRETLMRYPNGVEYVADIINARKWTLGGGKRAKTFKQREGE